jgi:hypothetical protein
MPSSIKTEHIITAIKFCSQTPLLLTIQLRHRINETLVDTYIKKPIAEAVKDSESHPGENTASLPCSQAGLAAAK